MNQFETWITGEPIGEFARAILQAANPIEFKMTGKYGNAYCRLAINEPETWLVSWYSLATNEDGQLRVGSWQEAADWCHDNLYPILEVKSIR